MISGHRGNVDRLSDNRRVIIDGRGRNGSPRRVTAVRFIVASVLGATSLRREIKHREVNYFKA